MPRLVGVDIPESKRVVISLTYIYGIGKHRAKKVLSQANIDPDKRTHELTGQELAKLRKILDSYKLEGDLKQEVRDNIEHHKRINTYRGTRHKKNLPVRGQRTRTNARTKRGARKTVGALKKEERTKQEQKRKKEDKE